MSLVYRKEVTAMFLDSKNLKVTDDNIKALRGTHLELELNQYLRNHGIQTEPVKHGKPTNIFNPNMIKE